MPTPAREPLLEETVLLPGGARIEIALWRGRAPGYRLCYARGAECLVRYEGAGDAPPRRQLRGRALPYAFRSVEQLRYDFERDVEALEAGGGARA